MRRPPTADRVCRSRDTGVDTIGVGVNGDGVTDRLGQVARLVDLVTAVNTEPVG